MGVWDSIKRGAKTLYDNPDRMTDSIKSQAQKAGDTAISVAVPDGGKSAKNLIDVSKKAYDELRSYDTKGKKK